MGKFIQKLLRKKSSQALLDLPLRIQKEDQFKAFPLRIWEIIYQFCDSNSRAKLAQVCTCFYINNNNCASTGAWQIVLTQMAWSDWQYDLLLALPSRPNKASHSARAVASLSAHNNILYGTCQLRETSRHMYLIACRVGTITCIGAADGSALPVLSILMFDHNKSKKQGDWLKGWFRASPIVPSMSYTTARTGKVLAKQTSLIPTDTREECSFEFGDGLERRLPHYEPEDSMEQIKFKTDDMWQFELHDGPTRVRKYAARIQLVAINAFEARVGESNEMIIGRLHKSKLIGITMFRPVFDQRDVILLAAVCTLNKAHTELEGTFTALECATEPNLLSELKGNFNTITGTIKAFNISHRRTLDVIEVNR